MKLKKLQALLFFNILIFKFFLILLGNFVQLHYGLLKQPRQHLSTYKKLSSAHLFVCSEWRLIKTLKRGRKKLCGTKLDHVR